MTDEMMSSVDQFVVECCFNPVRDTHMIASWTGNYETEPHRWYVIQTRFADSVYLWAFLFACDPREFTRSSGCNGSKFRLALQPGFSHGCFEFKKCLSGIDSECQQIVNDDGFFDPELAPPCCSCCQ